MPHCRSVALALLLVSAAASPSQAQERPATLEPMVPADGTVLDVTARGRVLRTPDLATVRAGVVTEAAGAAAALSDNARRMADVLAALRRAGVAPRDIATAQVGLQPRYREGEDRPPAIAGYQATNSVVVRLRDVGRAGPVLDALAAAGANQISGPGLLLAEPDAALDEARADAVKRARARADLYARAAGLQVVRMVSVAETGQEDGGPTPPVLYMARVAAADRTEIAAGETEVAVTLQVRFLLR